MALAGLSNFLVSLTVILSSGEIVQRRARQPCENSPQQTSDPLGETVMGPRFDSHRFRADRSACTEVRGLALTTAHPRKARQPGRLTLPKHSLAPTAQRTAIELAGETRKAKRDERKKKRKENPDGAMWEQHV
jgi:hypothetical protein